MNSRKPRYLTKSRFKLARECPTKLFYTGKKEYADQSQDDSFLRALAEGGFQVGELAKCYIPGGREVKTLAYEEALAETNELLKANEAVVYEAAVKFENLFIRADIFKKKGEIIDLIEVKSKSYSSQKDSFRNKDKSFSSKWEPYFYDIAFQTYVCRKAFPEFEIRPSLYLVDKDSKCPVEGLNQKFFIERESSGRGRAYLKGEIPIEVIENPILILVDMSDIVQEILFQKDFESNLKAWAQSYSKDVQIPPQLSAACTNCQFYAKPSDFDGNLKCGWTECWSKVTGLSDKALEQPTVLDLWDYKRKPQAIEDKKYFLSELSEDDIGLKEDDKPGLSRTERQWLQIKKAKENDQSPFLDLEALWAEEAEWRFPLHFIDFETTAVAIPFHKGKRPYEGIAFQFSHHTVQENGDVKHAGQYLHLKPGEFPNFEFIRTLKNQLDKDEGTIFRYAAHENSYLNFIIDQLEDSNEPDKQPLISFIKTIAKPTKARAGEWEPTREMVDMLQLVKRYFFHPVCEGSNSIKDVLPAILGSSKYLQDKYSKSIYGSAGGIYSLNFTNHQWLRFENGKVIDPYKQLPNLLSSSDSKSAEFIFSAEKINDGGSAMTAWARFQFTEMSEEEREALSSALLKYCELDTLAMVMIYEAWREELRGHELDGHVRDDLRRSRNGVLK